MADPNNPAGDKPEQQPLTKADVEALITAALGKTLTGALSRALSPAKLKPLITEVLTEMRVAPDKRPEGEGDGEGEGEGEGDGEGGESNGRAPKNPEGNRQPEPGGAPNKGRRGKAADPAEASLVTELQGKLTDLEAKWKRAEQNAAAERKRAIEQKGLADLRVALTGKARPDAVALAMDVIRARNMITYDKEGTARLKIRASLEAGAPEEDHEVDLEAGVAHFLKSKEGALFVPPPSRGAGSDRRILREPGALPPRQPGSGQGARGPDKLAELAERAGRNVDDLL